MSKTFDQLQDVIDDAEFPALDLALRRGVHVDRDAAGWYTLLSEAQALLEAFYRRYGCELVHKTDGYFYLLPTSDQLPRRQLASQDMLVGQALALLYLDPISLERGGLVTREQVIEQLVAALGTSALMAAFVPKRKRKDEQAAQRQVRAKIAESVRRLAALGFAEPLADEQLRLRPALLRFAEPVRGLAEPAEALAKLVAQGEVAVVEDEAELEAPANEDDASERDDDAEEVDASDEESSDADGEDTDTNRSFARSDKEAEAAPNRTTTDGSSTRNNAEPDRSDNDLSFARGNHDDDSAPRSDDEGHDPGRTHTGGSVDDPRFTHSNADDDEAEAHRSDNLSFARGSRDDDSPPRSNDDEPEAHRSDADLSGARGTRDDEDSVRTSHNDGQAHEQTRADRTVADPRVAHVDNDIETDRSFAHYGTDDGDDAERGDYDRNNSDLTRTDDVVDDPRVALPSDDNGSEGTSDADSELGAHDRSFVQRDDASSYTEDGSDTDDDRDHDRSEAQP